MDRLLKIISEKALISKQGSSKFISYIYIPSIFHKAIFQTIHFALNLVSTRKDLFSLLLQKCTE